MNSLLKRGCSIGVCTKEDGINDSVYPWRDFFHRFGAFIFWKPALIWKWTEQWKSYRADETSDFYLKTTKLGGILFVLFGVVVIVLLLVLE